MKKSVLVAQVKEGCILHDVKEGEDVELGDHPLNG